MITMLLYALGTACCAFVTEMWQLIIFRIIASLGIGGEWAAGSAMVAEVVPEESRVEAGALAVHLRAVRPVPRRLRERRGRGRLVRPRPGDVLALRAAVRPAARRRRIRRARLHPGAGALGGDRRHRGARARARNLRARTCARAPSARSSSPFVALITWWTCNAFIQALANSLAGAEAVTRGLDAGATAALKQSWIKIDIQASSRVGRSEHGPGLVFTLLSPAKPRDRSHFEHFRAFHQSIYRYVEPTSVTPFAVPVTERALHALVVVLARYWGGENQLQYPDPPSATLQARIRAEIENRVALVEVGEKDRVRLLLDRIFNEWQRLAPDIYGSFSPDLGVVPFMYPSGTHPSEAWDGRAYSTPSSMRNVDANCQASVISVFSEFESLG